MRSGRWSNDFNLAFKWWHFAATFLCTSLSALSVLHIFPGRSTTKTLPHTFPPQDQMSFKAETLLLSFTVAHFLRPRTLSGILIDHVFVSIHRGQIHHSNLSSCWCAELIMCRRGRGKKKRTTSCLDSSEVSPPHLVSKRAAKASLGYGSCLAPWVISVMNALAEQIVAVACLAHRVAVLSQLRGCGLIRVMDDSATGLSLNQQRLCWAGSTQFYSFTGFLWGFFSLKQLLTLLRASMLLMDVKWIFGRALTTINN